MKQNSYFLVCINFLWIGSLVSFLSACLETTPETAYGPKYELAKMISKQISRCWYATGAKDFTLYAVETDINPIFKRARILLLPKEDLEAKPVLVIEAHNKNKSSATISNYGPLMQQYKDRITQDLARWTAGSKACA